MRITDALYRAARLSRDVNAARRGPTAMVRRAARKRAHKATARLLRRIGL